MVATNRNRWRRGAAVVEFAIIAPLLLFIIFAEVVGGLGISRYQEVAHLARDCARYASTHGGDYYFEGTAQKSGVPSVVSSSELRTFLTNRVALLKLDQIEIDINWTSPTTLSPRNMPTYVSMDPNQNPPAQVTLQNYVIVTVKYKWFPETFFTNPITLTSTSIMPMSY